MCPALNRANYYTTQFSPANGVTVRKGLAQAIDKVKTASPYILSAFYKAHASHITKYNATQPKVIAALSKILQQLYKFEKSTPSLTQQNIGVQKN